MHKELCGYDEKRYDLEHREKKEARKAFALKIIFWLVSISLVVLMAFLIIHFGIDKTSVVNSSMEPTLSKDDSIIINTAAYKFGSPERFDVVVIKSGDNEHAIYDVKRIYGLPGETIQIVSGVIYINGEELKDVVKVEEMELAGLASEEIKLGDDEYFVLADDRNNAEDSRYSNYGMVHSSDIVGKAWIRTNKFGFVNMLNKTND